jgi:putative membrane protein insertion efficiency factor
MLSKITKGLCLLCLAIYQSLISPFTAASCRYHPTCSAYAKEAINIFGVKGVFLTLKRVLKCNPFFTGGYDPIPKKDK